MTNEEAIERLKQNKAAAEFYAGMVQNTNSIENELKDIEAMNMAIEALSGETPTVLEKHQLSEETPTNTPTDLISRQDALAEFIDDRDVFDIMESIESLPSADRLAGEWIEHEWAEEVEGLLISNYECSECHGWERSASNFCPNCGAYMKGENK